MDRKGLLELISSLNNQLKILAILEYYSVDYEEVYSGRYKALCPFHNDHAPSLLVFTDNESGRDSWWCPPCDENGDCFRFIQLMVEDHKEAVEVAQEITKKHGGKGGTNNAKYKEIQRKRRQEKKLLLRSHTLGVSYRDWLKTLKGTSTYKKACQRVDQIFEEMDKMLGGDDYKAATAFLRDKEKRLQKQQEKDNAEATMD